MSNLRCTDSSMTHGRHKQLSVHMVRVPQHRLDLVLAGPTELPVRLHLCRLSQVDHC